MQHNLSIMILLIATFLYSTCINKTLISVTFVVRFNLLIDKGHSKSLTFLFTIMLTVLMCFSQMLLSYILIIYLLYIVYGYNQPRSAFGYKKFIKLTFIAKDRHSLMQPEATTFLTSQRGYLWLLLIDNQRPQHLQNYMEAICIWSPGQI